MRFRKKKPGETLRPGISAADDADQRTRENHNIAVEACILASEVVYAGSDVFPPLKSAMGAAKKIAEWPAKCSDLKETVRTLERKANGFLDILVELEPHAVHFPPDYLYRLEWVRSEMQLVASEAGELKSKLERRGVLMACHHVLSLRIDSKGFGRLKERFTNSSEAFDRTCLELSLHLAHKSLEIATMHYSEFREFRDSTSEKLTASLSSIEDFKIIQSRYAKFSLFYCARPLATRLIIYFSTASLSLHVVRITSI